MQTITHEGLKTILESHGTQAEVVLATATVPRMRKTNNPYFDHLTKRSVVIGDICFNYEVEVNRQRHREQALTLVAGNPVAHEVAPFTAQSRVWGEKEQTKERVGALIYHGANAYLELLVKQSVSHEYRDDHGILIEPEAVKPFLYESCKPQTQGTEKEIIVRDYKLASIVSIILAGRTYQL